MKSLVKILLITVAGLVGVVIIASVALLLFVDPNDYRDRISAGVKEATGRDLTIEGELSLSVFPWPMYRRNSNATHWQASWKTRVSTTRRRACRISS